jgi:hypothetical protein
MTLMVRDEADIVAAMLEHHRNQGIDHVIVTDNGSVDGTSEILEDYQGSGFITVWNDPVHRKQQWSTVTKMARHAATAEAADWVVNADADEFWVPTSTSSTLRSLLESVPPAVSYLTVPVVNLTGAPAQDGTGLGRLRYRDLRTDEELHVAGIPFHPTADAVHRGNALVEVSQGNHFVSAPDWGEGSGADAVGLEVLHLPWRSWRQYEHKVRIAGQAYTSNPELTPSPRHHGMQDFRRLQGGRLEYTYVSKHPQPDEIDALVARGSLVVDDRLDSESISKAEGVRPDLLYTVTEQATLAERGRQFAALEFETERRMLELRAEQEYERGLWLDGRASLNAEIERLSRELETMRSRASVRAADRLRALTSRATGAARTGDDQGSRGSDQ